MKDDVRVMAIDDGPFRFGDEASLLVGLVVRGKGYLEAVTSTTVGVDRLDATDAHWRGSTWWTSRRSIGGRACPC